MRVSQRSGFTALVLFLGGGLLVWFVTPIWQLILPAKYFADGFYIRDLLCSSNDSVRFFDAFANTARAYRYLGLRCNSPGLVAGYLSAGIALLLIVISGFYGIKGLRFRASNMVLALLWLLVVDLYIGQYSKELFALTAVFAILTVAGFRFTYWLVYLIPVAYGLFFRKYWLLIALIFALMNVIDSVRWGKSQKTLAFLLWLVLLSTAYVHMSGGVFLTDVRMSLNESRVGSADALSMLRNPFANTSVLTDVANWFISWLMLFFVPLPLLHNFTIQRVGYLILVPTTCVLIFSIKNSLRWSSFVGSETLCRRAKTSFSFITAFTLTQAAFEPDFGSALKHMTALSPMLVFLLLASGKLMKQAPSWRLLSINRAQANRKASVKS